MSLRPHKLFQAMSPRAAMLVAVVVAMAGVGTITLAVLAREGSDGPGLDPAVEQLIPAADSEVLVQTNVGIDLVDSPSYKIVSFRLNGIELPQDEWLFSLGTQRLTYLVGDDQTVAELRPERNCARVEFYPTLEGAAATRQVSWCFSAA